MKDLAARAKREIERACLDLFHQLARAEKLMKRLLNCYLIALLTLSVLFPCSASTPPPVPQTYLDLYNSLNNYLGSFNTTLNGLWHGTKYPVAFTGTLTVADANSGPQLVNSGYYFGVQ